MESGVPRENFEILSEQGEALGKLTSGCFSPNLKVGIGMAYLPPSKVKKDGDPVLINIRNRKVRAVMTKLPFIPNNYYRQK